MLKKYIIAGFITLSISIMSFAAYKSSAFATNVTDNQSKQITQNIERITQNKYGKVVSKGNEDDLGIKHVAEDDKFKYKIDAKSGKFTTINAKDVNDFSKKSTTLEGVAQVMNKDVIISKAKALVQSYVPVSNKCSYVMTTFTDASKHQDNCYEVDFDELASNNVKTGTSVFVSVSTAGDFAGLATHIGNADIALKSKSKLTKEAALKIATDFIKSQDHLKNVKQLPEAEEELTVYEDNLSWKVKIDNIIGTGTRNGYIFYIDADNGNIIFKDNYCALE